MKEPKRLLSRGATEFERRLLGAVINERPSAALRSRMQRSLGFSGPFLWASNVKAMLADVAYKGTAGKAVLGLAAGGVVAAAGIAAAVAVGTISNPIAPESSPVQVAEYRPALAERPSVLEPAVQVEAPKPPAVEAAAIVASDDDGTASQLREEIALLDEARNALQRGARARAEGVLDAYRERFPRGLLSREAALLRRQTASRRDVRAGTVQPEPGASEAKQ